MKTVLLAFILFNIATFGEAYMDNCACIGGFAMALQQTNDVQALDQQSLKKKIMEIVDKDDDGCITIQEWGMGQIVLFPTTLDFGCTIEDMFHTIDGLSNIDACVTKQEIKKAMKRLKKPDQCPELQPQ